MNPNERIIRGFIGVFQMRDGRALVWRDHFDVATRTRAMAGRDPSRMSHHAGRT